MLGRALAGHKRSLAALLVGFAAYLVFPAPLHGTTRTILAWDSGAILFLVLAAILFAGRQDDASMGRNAKRQEEGEWTAFSVTLAAIAFSFAALTQELGGIKDFPATSRNLHVALVAATLMLSWLTTHIVFALRYAHEFYSVTEAGAGIDRGLNFPGDDNPDYWDFVYFALVLGMTFQVSDVNITSRKFRRLATVHGLISFVFSTVIVALTVNIASGLM